jgi:hypothetical protein
MVRRSIVALVAGALASACQGRHEAAPSASASAAGASEAGPRVSVIDARPELEGGAPGPAADAGAGCDSDARVPEGCDYATQACVRGHCQTCAEGTEPLMTRCATKCQTDRDCPRGLVCNFVAGDLFLCDEPAAKRSCPRGQIWLRSDGMCWKTCTTDRDCPTDTCCLMDPNAPVPICMGKCP